jgi:hypothetical protein
MKNSIKKLLASSLSLFLVGCSTATVPGQVPSLSAKNNAAVTPEKQGKNTAISLEKPTVNYTAEGSVSNNEESIQLKMNWLQPTGFSVQFAPYSDLKFIKVEVMGKNAAGVEKTWTTTGEYVAVSGRSATASVAGIPVVNGDLRIVKITGYDANKVLLPAFSTQSYYFSETAQLAIGITVDRQSALLSQVLNLLKDETFDDQNAEVADPRVLDLLKTAGDLTQFNTAFTEAVNFDMVTKTYLRDPSTFDAQKISDYILEHITAEGFLFSSIEEEDFNRFLSDGSAQITVGELTGIDITFSQSGGPNNGNRILGENLILMINDPTSKPLQIPVGTESGLSLDIPNIAPGVWTLTLAKEDGTVLGSQTITVNDNGVANNGSIDFNLSNQVKELREVSVELQMLDKMAKWGEPLFLNFSSRPGYKVPVDGESRYTHGAMIPVGETTVYVRTSTGKLLGESLLTVAANGSLVQAQKPLVLTGAKASEAQFVNTDTSGANAASKIARSSNGDYTIAWVQLPFGGSGEDGGLIARIYAADGTPKTDAFQVASANELFDGEDGFSIFNQGLQNIFDTGMDQAGNLVVTWSRSEINFGNRNTNIYAQVYNNAGVAQNDTPFRVHEEIENDQYMPSVAVQNNGQYVVTWSDLYDHGNIDSNPITSSVSPKIRGRLLDVNGINVGADEFYAALPIDVDDRQLASRTAINDNGDFVVSWVEFDDDIISDNGALKARVFNADGTTAQNGVGDDVIHVTDFSNAADMFTVNNLGDGSSFIGYFYGMHDISMGTQDKNFVVSWTNAGESEVEGRNGLPAVADSIYARHYYPKIVSSTQVFASSKTMAVSYNPNNVTPPLFEDGESYSYSMAPSVNMNSSGNFVVSWTQIDVLGRDELNRNNDPLNTPDEIDYKFDFNYKSAKKMSNVSLRSRIYTRTDNDLFNPSLTNLVNPNAFRPFPFGTFRPEEIGFGFLFNGGPYGFLSLLSFPVADIALTDAKKPIATWQYFDYFNNLNEEFFDGDSMMGTDISARVYGTPILAPVEAINQNPPG